ncbi:LysM peptidoglycan-binding domain-containing protein [Streptosporangium soli]|nr:LysM peptidoglycan-binding domain-containing protein [Streptosporangium sp. KLBMP 9127]
MSETSEAPETQPPNPVEPPVRPDSVTVPDSGSLWDIAEEHFEDGSRWQSIYNANRDVLDDPNALRAGMTLNLPMEFYPGHVRSVAGVFDREWETLGDSVRRAVEDLNAIGNFWGDGKEGTAFYTGEGGGRGYQAASTQAAEGADALLEANAEIPRLLRLMADRVETADWNDLTMILSSVPGLDDE